MPLGSTRTLSCIKTKNSTVGAITANPGLNHARFGLLQQRDHRFDIGLNALLDGLTKRFKLK